MKGRATFATVAVAVLAFASSASATIPPKLAAEARYVATHGGIVCQTPGAGARCATPRMRELSRRLIVAQFGQAGSYALNKALCIVGRESGFNPGARSTTGDHGLAQFNYAAHHGGWLDFGRVYDPVYATLAFWRMSGGGTAWSPWNGGHRRC